MVRGEGGGEEKCGRGREGKEGTEMAGLGDEMERI